MQSANLVVFALNVLYFCAALLWPSEGMSGASEQANGQASSPIIASRFLNVLNDHVHVAFAE